jgi:hypothetical protein
MGNDGQAAAARGVGSAAVTGFGQNANGGTLVPRYTLELIIVVLLLLWLFGAFINPFGGNLIHLLLVVLLVVVVIRVLQGRRIVD